MAGHYYGLVKHIMCVPLSFHVRPLISAQTIIRPFIFHLEDPVSPMEDIVRHLDESSEPGQNNPIPRRKPTTNED